MNGNGARWHEKYPHLGTDPLPANVFTSAEQFERERERIFKKAWLNVGRVEQIPHPGDYFVKDLAVATLRSSFAQDGGECLSQTARIAQ
jgi:hypothetical protein